MKFSIQEEGSEAPDKQIFFTFKEASEKTGILSKRIAQNSPIRKKQIFSKIRQKNFLDSE